AEPVRLERGFVLNEAARTVTYPVYGTGEAPLSDQDKIILLRELPIIQDTDLENQGAFFAETHEQTFDKIVMMIQQLNELMSRAVVGGVDQSGGGAAYEALLVAVEEARSIRDQTIAYVDGFDAHVDAKTAESLVALNACIATAEEWAQQSCFCAATSARWYQKIADVFHGGNENFFSTFFVLVGVADGGDGADFAYLTSDGGSASTVLFIDRVNDGMTTPDEWYKVNPMIAEALRGRSIISATLQDNGEIIFVTD
ncbi:MAG: hypothetical protein RRY12_12890, partial [Cloacibacillus sp.]